MGGRLIATDAACPCGHQAGGKGGALHYGRCCGRWMDGALSAPDAVSLMRSRYTAFVLERQDYLLATWHPTTRPAVLEFDPGARWLGLDVRAWHNLDATHATVEFVARQKPPQGKAWRLHEVSRFALEGGRWLYVDGVQL